MSQSQNNSGSSSWSTMSENILNDKYPLHRACRDGDVTTLSILLQNPESKHYLITEDAYYGWTPTHWAAYFGRLDCMRVLCGQNKLGFSTPNDLRTSRFNQTPSHIASFAGHPQCLQWLLQTGAVPDARDYLGDTPLHKAARSGSTECVSLLAAQKAGIGHANNNGQSAAQLAKACGHANLCQYILQLEESQVRDTTCSITKSIPSHGINAGVLPPTPSQPNNKPIISSNGYYGFQPSTNGTNGETPSIFSTQTTSAATNGDEDCEMETDAAPNIPDQQPLNGLNSTNGHQQPSSSTSLTSTPSVSGINNGDITLDLRVSQNHVAIGGRKRSREDSPIPLMKRTRREGPENVMNLSPQRRLSPFESSTKSDVFPSWNAAQKGTNITSFITSPKISSGSKACLGSMIDHACSVGVEKVYETTNIEMIMTEMHGC